jgi:hypothetical protein
MTALGSAAGLAAVHNRKPGSNALTGRVRGVCRHNHAYKAPCSLPYSEAHEQAIAWITANETPARMVA